MGSSEFAGDPEMDSSTATRSIVDALTKAIVEHRLHPGTKLAEQKLADHFGVSAPSFVRRCFNSCKSASFAWSPHVALLWPRPLLMKPAKCLPCAA